MQNLVFFMEPSQASCYISLKAGKMYFNRFCIDEAAAFELSGVHYLSTQTLEKFSFWDRREFELEIKEKGKQYSFLYRFYTLIVLY